MSHPTELRRTASSSHVAISMPALAMPVSPCATKSRNVLCSFRSISSGARGIPSIKGARFERSLATGSSTKGVGAEEVATPGDSFLGQEVDQNHRC
jgi:hypothetical protein